MGNDFINELLAARRAGKKLESVVLPPDLVSPEEAFEQMRYQTVNLTYKRKSGEGFRDAEYSFDLDGLTWKRTLLDIWFDDPETGTIPAEAAERFARSIAFIVNLRGKGPFETDTKRIVPTTEEERYIYQSDTKRLSHCFLRVYPTLFKWVPEVDTGEPYGKLYEALMQLMIDCGLE